MQVSKGNYSNFAADIHPQNEERSRDYKAEAYFRSIKRLLEESSRTWHLAFFKQQWPDYVPEPFYATGNYKRRKAYGLLAGQLSGKPSDNCGPVGRLRVLAGKPLERSIIPFDRLPKVRKFVSDPDAQYHQQVMDWVKEDLAKFFVKGPFVAFVERGMEGGNHVNVLHKQGACKRGARRIIPDHKLFVTVLYFCKKPYWNDENALAYLRSGSMNTRVAKRFIRHRLGDCRTGKITVLKVEQILKMKLLKSSESRMPS